MGAAIALTLPKGSPSTWPLAATTNIHAGGFFFAVDSRPDQAHNRGAPTAASASILAGVSAVLIAARKVVQLVRQAAAHFGGDMKLPDAIITKRLTIRPFQQDDLDSYLSFMADERATKYLVFTDEQKTAEGAKDLFATVVESYGSNNPIFAYAIALKGNRYIGSCGISEISDDDVFECYYGLLPRYWKNGFATEAAQALIRYCFYHYPIQEIRAYMSRENPNSSSVAERVGMAYRGIQKHPLFGTRGRVYSITREKVEELEASGR